VEFLTTFTVAIPAGAAADVVDDLTTREAQRAYQLAQQGKLVRLWTLPAEPGTSRALGLWRAQDLSELQAILTSLPLDPWMTTQTTPLTEHHNDPATTALRSGNLPGPTWSAGCTASARSEPPNSAEPDDVSLGLRSGTRFQPCGR
jgi:muconolactone delta-isomerase